MVEYHELLEQMRDTRNSKAKDYSIKDNPFSNFEFAANLASGFTSEIDKVFATLIGIKLARLQVLTQPGKVPSNESVEDTRKDLTIYCSIWWWYSCYFVPEKEEARATDTFQADVPAVLDYIIPTLTREQKLNLVRSLDESQI